MKPKIKKSGQVWMVYGWDLKYVRLYNSWKDAIDFALSLKFNVKR